MTTQDSGDSVQVVVRPMLENDLDRVDLIFRTAFGTFFGALEPETVFGDTEMIRTRWHADPGAGVVAELDGIVVGSNLVTTWGSFGFFGPLTVHPDHWDRGVAHRLMEATMELFRARGTPHLGLFTFAHSPKHIVLYQRFGFWPRFLTAVMEAPVTDGESTVKYSKFSECSPSERAEAKRAVGELTDAVYRGLDLSGELEAVADQKLGETVLVEDGSGLQAVAICHIGPGTEAGSDMCYVKFAAARPGPDAVRSFDRLLDACNELAARSGTSILQAGVSFGRVQAYEALRRKGFRTQFQGVAMHRPNEDGYDTATSLVLDDWR